MNIIIHKKDFFLKENIIAFASGGNVTEPPSAKDPLKWPTGAFDTSINRTGQAKPFNRY